MFDNLKSVAIYARVSTEEQAEEGYSIQAQLDTLRQYAKQNRYIVSKEYKDEGISGKSIQNRPQLQQLLRDAKQGLFQEVIVWKINRISRNQLDLLTIVDELQKHGVSFRSYTENFETETPMGRFALQMMGSVAELERNTIVDNVKMGMKQRARQGKWNGGKVLGYESVEVEGSTFRKRKETRLVIVESEAALVRMIFEKYASGKGIKAIANELNHLGYKTKWGKPFSVVAVKDILNNPLYVGKIRFNKQENWTVKRRKGTNASPILADGEHEPIISEELWNTVQAMYKTKSEKPAQVFHGSFPFTGVMRCPMCGHGMVAQRATRKNKNGEIKYTLYYQCGQFANKGSAVCRANSVRADYAEEEILARIEKIVSQPQITADVAKELGQRQEVDKEPLEQELKHVDKKLADLKRKISKYFVLYENDQLEAEELRKRVRELSEMEQRLSIRKAEIENQLKSGDITPIPFEVLKGMLREFRKVFKRADHVKRKQLVHALIKEITVTSGRKIDKIEWKFDDLKETLLVS
ncbi:recombinase family protein [Brevibacillus fulvus]|uniref:Site-specific DNA recombinase n=1 Tax=Brevibacillus fulvus TaxID=1125967 RepID=A0A939BWG0_9BACL|nr:recombinase family protein [Brevibacillus fulvus]MBM7591781.1 site-specific DNA recombinase [Brevibacillus fulvus]